MVRCCSKSGAIVDCISKDPDCFGKHTYDDAVKLCAAKGRELCTKATLERDCCDTDTGCNYDDEWVWVSDRGMPFQKTISSYIEYHIINIVEF